MKTSNNSISPKTLTNLSIVLYTKKDFDFKDLLEKYKNTRFEVYQKSGKYADLYIKIAFFDKNQTKTSLIQDLSSNKKVIEFKFHKTWKGIQDDFQEQDSFTLVEKKRLQVGFALKKKKV